MALILLGFPRVSIWNIFPIASQMNKQLAKYEAIKLFIKRRVIVGWELGWV